VINSVHDKDESHSTGCSTESQRDSLRQFQQLPNQVINCRTNCDGIERWYEHEIKKHSLWSLTATRCSERVIEILQLTKIITAIWHTYIAKQNRH